MKNIAFLTSQNYQTIVDKCPDFLDEFKLLQPIFKKMGVNFVAADWQDQTTNWQQFDLLIPKACWNYTEVPLEFERFILERMQQHIPFQNHADIILWNMRKTYLLDLLKRGLPVAELFIVPQGQTKNTAELTTTLQENFPEQNMFVAKPSIGAGASDTIRFNLADIQQHESLLQKILSYADLVLQPYFPEIAHDGEYSYFFFGNEFSHAIHKIPARGDYRAHQLYGAKNIPYQPSFIEIKQALQFIQTIKPDLAYGRVDVFKRNGTQYLIELELIEPYLYFENTAQNALPIFCEAVLSRI